MKNEQAKHLDQSARLVAADIPVSAAMIEAGLAVLEETNEWPLSTGRVERAFQEMYLCGFFESQRESSGR